MCLKRLYYFLHCFQKCKVTQLFSTFSEKVPGVHQLQASAGYEKWQICAWVQTDSENDSSGQSQVGHPRQQLSCFEVSRCVRKQF